MFHALKLIDVSGSEMSWWVLDLVEIEFKRFGEKTCIAKTILP
jgi:hypothetical protein